MKNQNVGSEEEVLKVIQELKEVLDKEQDNSPKHENTSLLEGTVDENSNDIFEQIAPGENIEAENVDLKASITKIRKKSDKKAAKKKIEKRMKQKKRDYKKSHQILPENELFVDLLGKEILLTMKAEQLNLLGQTFRPIFCGKVVAVTNGFLTLDPVIIKMSNAPFHRFPTPLSFPLELIVNFVPFDCDIQFPIP